jgi:hypothetical protein
MTPRQIELVQSSFNLVAPNLESAAMTFYDSLGLKSKQVWGHQQVVAVRYRENDKARVW